MKCIVKDCANHASQGKFIGSLCAPCHAFITTGVGKYSQAYRNAILIAEVPELLEALQLADALLSGANMNVSVVEKKVKSAIAKATGETV
jgi:hypothetical protein